MPHPTSSGQLAAGEREDAQVSRLLTWLSATAIGFLVGIGAKAWFAGHTTHASVLWSFIGLIALNMLYYASTGNRVRQKAGMIVIVGLLFTYLIASGGESNTGPLWFYVFPPLLFYLTDLKTGTAVLLPGCRGGIPVSRPPSDLRGVQHGFQDPFFRRPDLRIHFLFRA
ncbi:hypothetical protein [Marinobacter sp. es.048]|uniref:hypothetical protein n=1 Tax=Marinobacter sp. es.048 TaxID=1761795 RepID=UPI001E40B505|nr:hypothetical protein [Marinobacter sp. es.048]